MQRYARMKIQIKSSLPYAFIAKMQLGNRIGFRWTFKVVFFPECFDYIGRSSEETLNFAVALDSDYVQQFQKLANQLKLWISLGGLHEKVVVPVSDFCISTLIKPFDFANRLLYLMQYHSYL